MGLQFKMLFMLFTTPFWVLSPLNAQISKLPQCIKDTETLQRIEKIQKENSKNSRRYDGYRDALGNSTDLEIFTRLAYAETLAANCPDFNAEISDLIVGVIGQRIIKRARNIQSVVFERSQFSSSLHIYKNSRYRDFLCPQDTSLWQKTCAHVTDFFAKKSTELPADTFHYFLYKHDPRWTKEPWNLSEAQHAQRNSSKNCIRLFRNPDWR